MNSNLQHNYLKTARDTLCKDLWKLSTPKSLGKHICAALKPSNLFMLSIHAGDTGFSTPMQDKMLLVKDHREWKTFPAPAFMASIAFNYQESWLIDATEVQVTCLCICVNITMALCTGLSGVALDSHILLSDALHALNDLIFDLVALSAQILRRRYQGNRYFDLQRLESFASFLTSALFMAGGLSMCLSSAKELHRHISKDAVQSSHRRLFHYPATPNSSAQLMVAGVAGCSLLVRYYLYKTSKSPNDSILLNLLTTTQAMQVACNRNSSTLAAYAMHHYNDSLTDIVPLLTVISGYLFGNLVWLEPAGSLTVSLFILHAGTGNAITAIRDLCTGKKVGNADCHNASEFRCKIRKHDAAR